MAIKILLVVAMVAFATSINGRNLPLEKATGDVDTTHFPPYHGVFGGYRGGPGVGFGGFGGRYGNGGFGGRFGGGGMGGGIGSGGDSNTDGRVGPGGDGSFESGAHNGGGVRSRGRNASGNVIVGRGGNVGGGSESQP